MKTINTRYGDVLVDDDTFAMIGGRKVGFTEGYPHICVDRRSTLLHQLVLNVPDGQVVDHENRNKLDCQRSNLRPASHCQNHWNVEKRPGYSSRFKGVYFSKPKKKWVAYITIMRSMIYIGIFADEEEAAYQYNVVAAALHGEFAVLNDV